MGKTTRISTPDGDAGAFLATPSDPPGPPVLALHAWWGLNGMFRDLADRLAGDGFTVLAPDLFDGRVLGTIAEAESFAQDELDEEANTERLLARSSAALDHLLRLPETQGDRAAVLGISFGGAYARWLAKSRPEIAGLVTYYGGGWDPPGEYRDPPAAWLSHWAEKDEFEEAPAEPTEAANPLSASHTYPQTKHWFAEPDRPEYVDAASDLAYARTIEFLRSVLGLRA
jgi:carboxymethylenebutenolidase